MLDGHRKVRHCEENFYGSFNNGRWLQCDRPGSKCI